MLQKGSHMTRLSLLMCLGCLAGSILAGQPETAPTSWLAKQAYSASPATGYTTVFVVHDGFRRAVGLAVLLAGLGAVGLGAAFIWIRRLKIPKWWTHREGMRPGILLVWGIALLLVSGIGSADTLFRGNRLVSVYNNGTAGVVEGKVHVLREQPEGGHGEGDLIEINGIQLVVDNFEGTAAYMQTIAHGGALREGAIVRVWHHDGKVLRLDVKR